MWLKSKVYYKMINKLNKLLSLMKIYVLCLSRDKFLKKLLVFVYY